MDRGSFLKRMGAFAVGAWLGRGLELPTAVVRDSTLTPVADYQLFGEVFENSALVARGGLCAPLSPIYVFPDALELGLVRDALPAFTAERGGVKIVPH